MDLDSFREVDETSGQGAGLTNTVLVYVLCSSSGRGARAWEGRGDGSGELTGKNLLSFFDPTRSEEERVGGREER